MTQPFNKDTLKNLYIPPRGSHKGQNGKLMIIGGSDLFHGASLWALKVASRIVDMVFYSSTPENNELTQKLKSELYDFIALTKDQIEEYVLESDAVLIGPGLPREEGRALGEEKTRDLVYRLLRAHPDKKWIIDAGALTEMDPDWLLKLNGNVIITPHPKEFEALKLKIKNEKLKMTIKIEKLEKQVEMFAQEYKCVTLLKGKADLVCSSQECVEIVGGNAGMTKGGTGDVLAGLVAALACKNDLFLSAVCGSYINKKAGESLFKCVGYYFNATDLADEIPKVMKELLNC